MSLPPASAFLQPGQGAGIIHSNDRQSVWKSALLNTGNHGCARMYPISDFSDEMSIILRHHMYPCVCVCTLHQWSCWDFSCLMRPDHEKREMRREMLWKERNPLIMLAFSCVLLFYHVSPPSCACVCAPASKSYHHTAVFSYVPVISLCLCLYLPSLPPPPTPLPPAFILSMSDCAPAIPSVSTESIPLHHAPTRLKKWQNNPSYQEHWALRANGNT